MDKEELEQRTKEFAMHVIEYVSSLPKGAVSYVLGTQLLKSGTSVGANYREANRAHSKRDFMHKVSIVEKEASETQYWLELLDKSQLGCIQERSWLLQEASELTAIFTAIGRSCKTKDRIKIRNSKSEIRNNEELHGKGI